MYVAFCIAKRTPSTLFFEESSLKTATCVDYVCSQHASGTAHIVDRMNSQMNASQVPNVLSIAKTLQHIGAVPQVCCKWVPFCLWACGADSGIYKQQA